MDEREIIQKFEEYGIDSAGNLGGYRIRYVSDTENHIIFSECESVIAFFFDVDDSQGITKTLKTEWH